MIEVIEDQWNVHKEQKIIQDINEILINSDFECVHHSIKTAFYDFSLINKKTETTECLIEFEIVENTSSDWKKGNCWWANKKGNNRYGDPFGIHIPYRKKKYCNLYEDLYWMKCNIDYSSFIIVKGKHILSLPYKEFENNRMDMGSNLYYCYGDELGDNGVYDVSLIKGIEFIFRGMGYEVERY